MGWKGSSVGAGWNICIVGVGRRGCCSVGVVKGLLYRCGEDGSRVGIGWSGGESVGVRWRGCSVGVGLRGNCVGVGLRGSCVGVE